ncbi:hypothetical protein BpHYR1_043372 [Brachionus plicatilis]|uniref:Uncharacterized protein n=1 Tax=Brachionus plicatilis TaxID=10195 RepID=A0A3M7RHK4_BRAPC|nr:hypothetical protein BpHYR1_043372 [Brachionus plicatilis]
MNKKNFIAITMRCVFIFYYIKNGTKTNLTNRIINAANKAFYYSRFKIGYFLPDFTKNCSGILYKFNKKLEFLNSFVKILKSFKTSRDHSLKRCTFSTTTQEPFRIDSLIAYPKRLILFSSSSRDKITTRISSWISFANFPISIVTLKYPCS